MRVHRSPKRPKRSSAPPPQPVAGGTPTDTVSETHQGFLLHAVAAIAAVVAVVMLSQSALSDGSPLLTASLIGNAADGPRVEIGLEHDKPVTVSLSLTENGPTGVADIRHDALETIHVSLPSSWIRREVGGVPLAAVTADAPALGFTRWSIPAGATVSFTATPPSSILLHNPSGIPAEIELTRVDLNKNAVDRNIILIQEGSALLW